MIKEKVEKAQEVIDKHPLKKEPSIISSPIKHEVLSANKNHRKHIEKKNPLFLTEQEKLGLLHGDRTHIELEEKQYDVHNANGEFTCKCSLCKENDFNTTQIQKGLKSIPEKLQ